MKQIIKIKGSEISFIKNLEKNQQQEINKILQIILEI